MKTYSAPTVQMCCIGSEDIMASSVELNDVQLNMDDVSDGTTIIYW